MKIRYLAAGSVALAIATLPLTAASASIGLQNATATFSQTFNGLPFTIDQALDGIETGFNGWAIAEGLVSQFSDPTHAQTAVFETTSNLTTAPGTPITFTLKQLFGGTQLIGSFRLSATTDSRATFADGQVSGGDVTANWTVLTPFSALSSDGGVLNVLGDGAILASGAMPASTTYTISALTNLQNITGFRLEVLEDASLPKEGPGLQATYGNFVLTEFAVTATPVPEPAMWLTMALGLGLVGYSAVRKRAV